MLITEQENPGVFNGVREDAHTALLQNAQTLEEQSPVSMGDALSAAFRLDNEVVSLAVSEATEHIGDEYDLDFYAADHLGEFEGTDHEFYLLTAKNFRHMESIKSDIRREQADRELLGRSDNELVARLAAGILSPLTLLPGSAIVKGAKGASVVKSVVKGGAVGTAAMAASEGALQATQYTRSLEESAYAIAGGAVLGGILGGASARMTNSQFRELAQKLEKDRAMESLEVTNLPTSAEARSVGAAQVQRFLDEELLLKGRGAQMLSRVVRPFIPFARVTNAASARARETYLGMTEAPIQIAGNANGTLGLAAETELKLRDRHLGRVYRTVQTQFKQAKKAEKEAGLKPMSEKEFRERVSFAMRNDDIDPQGNIHVTQAAKSIRKDMFDPLLKDAQELELISEDVEPRFAKSYLTRMWSKQKMIANRPQAIEMFKGWATRRVEAFTSEIDQKIAGLKKELEVANMRRDGRLQGNVKAINEELDGLNSEIDNLRQADTEIRSQKDVITSRLRDLRRELKEADTKRSKGIQKQIKQLEDQRKELTSTQRSNTRKAKAAVENKNEVLRLQKQASGGSGARSMQKIMDEITELEVQKRSHKNIADDGYSEYIEEVATDVYNKLTTAGPGDLPDFIAPVSRGPLREKVLDIADNDAADFLENDIAQIASYYNQTMGSQIALKRRFGSIDLKQQLDEINKEYDDLVAVAPDAKTRQRLNKERRSVEGDIKDARDLLLGTYQRSKNPDSMLNQAAVAIKDLTYMAYLGGVTLSSFPDIFRNVMVHGFGNAFGDLASRIDVPKEWRKMAREDLEEMSFGFESVLATRMSTLADVNDPYARGSALTRFTGTMAAGFSKMTMINHWNDIMKNWAATTTQLRVLRKIDDAASGKLSAKDKAYFNFLGIDQNTASVIAQQFKKHGKKKGKAYIAGIKNWDDVPEVNRAARAFSGALRKEADTIIVTKGISDTPTVANSPVGSLVLQFKSFMLASNQRVLMRGLSDGDANALMGATMMIGAGMVTAAVKQMERELAADITGRSPGESVDTWEVNKWIAEGLDRSGLLSIFWEANNVYEKAGGYGFTRAMGAAPASRYASRDLLGSLIPAAGYLNNGIPAMVNLAVTPFTGEDVYKSDINSVRRSLPFQNLIGFRYILDLIQAEANEATDAR